MNMERSAGLLLLASTALPALFSCTREMEPVQAPEPQTLVIKATREGDGPATKTELVDGKTYWSVGDKISIFFGKGTDGGAEFSSLNTEPSASADFTGVLTAVTGSENGSSSRKYFWGVYPYSENNSVTLSGSLNYLTTVVSDVQYGMADSYSPGQNVWIGHDLGLELSFKSLLSGIKFTFSRGDIGMVTIEGNNGEYLAGKVNVLMDSGVPEVSGVLEGKTVLTLKPYGGGTFQSGTVYRALFLPTNFTEGLTVRFFTTTNSMGTRTFGSLNFERNKPKNAENADFKDVTWENYSVTGISTFEHYNYAMSKGSTLTLSTTALPEYAWNAQLTWESSSPSVASVSEDGVVTALSAGTAMITATTVEGGYSTDCYVTVLSDAPKGYVNMGNGINMATCNVGADSPEEVGDYFAWGETSPKSTYTWSNYKWGTQTAITKYNENSSLGTIDGLTTLEAEDDAATVNLGSRWRIPTKDEIDSLEEICETIEANMNGKNGYILKSVVTDNTVFIPMSGEMGESGLALEDEMSFFWTSTLYTSFYSTSSYTALMINVDGLFSNNIQRYYGYPVRAVYTAPSLNGHEYVEMGDGLKWATTNIGAENPEDYGDYFAWGETVTKESYSWATYKHMQEGQSGWKHIIKYTFADSQTEGIWYDSEGNFIGDGKTSLKDYDYADDAARQIWKGTWRIPTDAEWTALRNADNFDWTWTLDYEGTGVAGQIVTSKVSGYEGNSIFLPAAGLRYGTSLRYAGSGGDYWSSSLYEDNSGYAGRVLFDSGGVGRSSYDRYDGLSVRPVSE